MFNDQNANNRSSSFGRTDNSSLGKKNPGDLSSSQGVSKETISVHAMPPKFVTATQRTGHLTAASSGSRQGKKLLLISISLILVIIIVIGGAIYFINSGKGRFNFDQLFTKNQNTNEAVNENVNQNINENSNDNSNQNINQNTNEAVNENVNQNINENSNDNSNQNINQNTNESPNYQLGVDADNDGLTSEEEFVFGSNPDLEDTDKDGYKDGQEITNLYNPLAPAQDLFSSGLVKKFISSNYGYTFFRPNTWTAKVVGTVSNIIILPDSESGESFNIEITTNPEGKIAEQLLAEGASVFGDFRQYQNYSLAGVSAYRSIDGRKVLAVNNGFVFVISHQVGSSGQVNFDNIFEMMLKSFAWIEIENPDVNQ